MQFQEAYDPARALQAGFDALRRSPGPLLLGGFLLFVLDGFSGSGGSFQFEDMNHRAAISIIVAAFLFLGCVGILALFAKSWVEAGYVSAVRRTLREGHSDVGDVFSDRSRWFPAGLTGLLQLLVAGVALLPFGIIVFVGQFAEIEMRMDDEVVVPTTIFACLMYLPVWIYIVLGFALARMGVMAEGLSPIEAMGRSWRLVRGNRWLFFVYCILCTIVGMLGFLLCCVGVVFTAIWVRLAWIDSYFALIEDKHPTWWISQTKEVRDAAPRPTAG